MFHYNILGLFIIVCCLKDSLALDCIQYRNDLDIINGFPFPIKMFLEEDEYWVHQNSAFLLSKNSAFVESIIIKKENVVPSSVFCLSNLTMLRIVSTPFENSMFRLVSIVNFYSECLFRYCT